MTSGVTAKLKMDNICVTVLCKVQSTSKWMAVFYFYANIFWVDGWTFLHLLSHCHHISKDLNQVSENSSELPHAQVIMFSFKKKKKALKFHIFCEVLMSWLQVGDDFPRKPWKAVASEVILRGLQSDFLDWNAAPLLTSCVTLSIPLLCFLTWKLGVFMASTQH